MHDGLLSRRDFLKLSGLMLGALAVGDPISRNTERLYRIQKYGPASRIPALEFHGDNYFFYNGAYCMDPRTFLYLMAWLQENEFWAVTSDELVAYIQGALTLPARSIILTTDSGNGSMKSLSRMIPVLQKTGMHFISFIWTRYMLAGESVDCQQDVCWESFRTARDSGVFSFGSHTESHRDFATLNLEDGLKDLLESKKEIEDFLGISPQLISWPFESVPDWVPSLAEYGFRGGFAGSSRNPMLDNVVLPGETAPWSMPRIFPPNTGSLTSGRPAGKNIQQLMEMFTDGFGEKLAAYQKTIQLKEHARAIYFRKGHPRR
jgi:peptidoglycan/xylan/chitin deacetylase (PgdA/CDA1 family)